MSKGPEGALIRNRQPRIPARFRKLPAVPFCQPTGDDHIRGAGNIGIRCRGEGGDLLHEVAAIDGISPPGKQGRDDDEIAWVVLVLDNDLPRAARNNDHYANNGDADAQEHCGRQFLFQKQDSQKGNRNR